jgi:aryl-alcohol dehydrogenase-like predicted oxidoreductase
MCSPAHKNGKPNMKKRKLGNSGLELAPLAVGGNVFGWTIDEPASFQVLGAFVAAGFNFVDTADMYSIWKPGNKGGESETILGNWMKKSGNRKKVLIATKVGMDMGPGKKGLSKDYILRAAEASLGRLQTDYIDLYQAHTDDTAVPLQETLEAFGQLVKEGKVRAIGASNYSGPRLSEAVAVSKKHGLPRYESLQPLYNLYDRADYEANLEPVCRENGIGVIAYYSLASGFLTGKYRSEADLAKSARGAGIRKYLNPRGFRILEALDQVAKRYNSTPAKISLAWLLTRPTVTAPIASATNVTQLQELVDATNLQLDRDSIALHQASATQASATQASAAQ